MQYSCGGLPNSRKPQWVIKNEQKEDNKEDKTTKKAKSNVYLEMPKEDVGGGGSGYVQTKVKGVRFILYIFTQIFEKNVINSKEVIERICRGEYQKEGEVIPYGEGDGQESLPDGVKNFLLHLCEPEEYAPIAKTDDKKKIVKAFIEKVGNKKKVKAIDRGIKSIIEKIFESEESVQKKYYIDNEDNKDNEITFYDNKIEILKALLTDDGKTFDNFSFYNDNISWLWRSESDSDSDSDELSKVKRLEYKKAMVLYGPPGTGKTYTAMELAKQILVRNIKDIGSNDFNALCKSNIKYLQLHVNYSYENFIAGQVIKDGNIVTQEGFIFKLVEAAQKEVDKVNKENERITSKNEKVKPKPFVVILDEMNRVDVSRVFGELFTAIEKRGTQVNLTLPDPNNPDERLTLTIPENVYFIGTMNEIDFSLEQIDFALRRRFIWELADYDSESLLEIIRYRLEKDSNNQYKSRVGDFINCCDGVNETIEGHDLLGEKYHIGHAFFAEITEIIKKIESENPTENPTEKQIEKNWNKAKNILWQISILPTLDAYCGTMEHSAMEKFIKDCENKYNGN